MRIGMMADFYKPHISGVTNHIALSKRQFQSSGHEVFVFTFGDEGYQDDESNVIRSPSLPLPVRYGDHALTFGVRYSKPARTALQTMDLVHLHHPFLSGTLALRYCRPKEIPIVFTNHTRYDLYLQALLPQLPEGVGRAFLEAYLPSFCRSCDLVIAPSEGIANVLESLGIHTNVMVIPNGVELDRFQKTDERLARSQIGFTAEDILLIYVGRLGLEKNLPFLLRAFAGAVQAYENLGLILVGDGPERDNLEDRVKHMGVANRVKFTGVVPYEMIPEYLACADAFVTASVSEVHPLSVIEAMAAGLPVLGIQSPGVGDIVSDGINGYLTSDDLAAFTAKLVRLAVDQEIRGKMSAAACKEADLYAIERTSALLLNQYQTLIAKRGTRNRRFYRRVARWLPAFRK